MTSAHLRFSAPSVSSVVKPEAPPTHDDPPYIVIDFQPRDGACAICGAYIPRVNRGIPLLEGIPVPKDWLGPWGGFPACEDCFQKYEHNQLTTWKEGEYAYDYDHPPTPPHLRH